MIDLLLYGLLALAVIGIGLNFLQRYLPPHENDLGIEGKLIWVDRGRQTKPFFNNVFEVLGKPDLMYRIFGGVLAVEYKSRRGPVFKSDVIQAKCAALAARGNGYKVIRILVKTSTVEQYIDLPKSDKTLFHEVEEYVILTRQAKAGQKMKALPNPGKCRSCAFNYDCKYAQR